MEPKTPVGAKAVSIKADLTNPDEIEKLYQTELGVPDTVYCLHGIMSRGSEDNFDLGLKVRVRDVLTVSGVLIYEGQVNIDSIRLMLQAARKYGANRPAPLKFIFTSSIAVYGGPLVCGSSG